MKRATKGIAMAALLPLSVAPAPAAVLPPVDEYAVVMQSPLGDVLKDALQGVLCAEPDGCDIAPYLPLISLGPDVPPLFQQQNIAILEQVMSQQPDNKPTMLVGSSGGATVLGGLLDKYQNDPDAPSPDDVVIVVMGNPNRAYGGSGPWFGDPVTPATDYQVIDITRQYDPISDFPANPFNLLTLANAAAGFFYMHLDYNDVDIDSVDPDNVWTVGNTTYVFVPTGSPPLLEPLRQLGLAGLADALDGPLKVLVELGYSRSNPLPESGVEPGRPTDGFPDGYPGPVNQSITNIPVNLINAVANVPASLNQALNTLSYALEVTENWWVYQPNNVLGFDVADPPKVWALAELLMPFPALSIPLSRQLSYFLAANLPMNAGCTGAPGPCPQAAEILSKMFLVPSGRFTENGYIFPTIINPISGVEETYFPWDPVLQDWDGEGERPDGTPWSGAHVTLDPWAPIQSVADYLLGEPTGIDHVSDAEWDATFQRLAAGLWLDFNPFVPSSYLYDPRMSVLSYLTLPFAPMLCDECREYYANPDLSGPGEEGNPLYQQWGVNDQMPKWTHAQKLMMELSMAVARGVGGPAVANNAKVLDGMETVSALQVVQEQIRDSIRWISGEDQSQSAGDGYVDTVEPGHESNAVLASARFGPAPVAESSPDLAGQVNALSEIPDAIDSPTSNVAVDRGAQAGAAGADGQTFSGRLAEPVDARLDDNDGAEVNGAAGTDSAALEQRPERLKRSERPGRSERRDGGERAERPKRPERPSQRQHRIERDDPSQDRSVRAPSQWRSDNRSDQSASGHGADSGPSPDRSERGDQRVERSERSGSRGAA